MPDRGQKFILLPVNVAGNTGLKNALLAGNRLLPVRYVSIGANGVKNYNY